jgi:hypothetical protein
MGILSFEQQDWGGGVTYVACNDCQPGFVLNRCGPFRGVFACLAWVVDPAIGSAAGDATLVLLISIGASLSVFGIRSVIPRLSSRGSIISSAYSCMNSSLPNPSLCISRIRDRTRKGKEFARPSTTAHVRGPRVSCSQGTRSVVNFDVKVPKGRHHTLLQYHSMSFNLRYKRRLMMRSNH